MIENGASAGVKPAERDGSEGDGPDVVGDLLEPDVLAAEQMRDVDPSAVTLTEAKAYFEALEAPRKGFYTFPGSAHSPMLEDPDRLDRILEQDVLGGATSLADPM